MLLKQIKSAIGYGLLFGVISAAAGALVIGLVYDLVLEYREGQYAEVAYGLLAGIVIVGVISGAIYGSRRAIKQEAKHRQEEAESHRAQQEGYGKQMVVLCEGTIALFESMAKHLDTAEKWLDQAEVYFAEDAFVPFWDSVENAANWLARFDEGVRQIKDKSSHYTELIEKYEDKPPKFPLAPRSVEKLGVGMATAERMKTIVGDAERNFQFAMIYEQRKTNQILVAGFNTLADALERMTLRITASLDDLAGSVNASLRAISSQLGEIAETSREYYSDMRGQVSGMAEREREAVDMLDNIQRGRRP